PVFQNHTLYLKASKPYHSVSPEYRQLSVSSGNKYNTEFTVTPIAQDLTKGKLKGKVTESGTNNPINGAFIYVSKTNTGFSNAQGDYGIADIAPGTYTVKAIRNDYQDAQGTAVITANQETALNFTLSKKAVPTPSQSSSPSPSTQPDSTKFTFIAEIVDATDTDSLVGGVKVEISPNPIINNVYGWEETSTDKPADETKYDKANLVAEDLLQPTPDCSSKNTTYAVTYTHPDYQTYTPQTFNCSEIKFDQNLQTYFYNAHRISLSKKLTFIVRGEVYDEKGNTPLSDIKIEVFRESVAREKKTTRTNSEGKFLIENMEYDESMIYKIIASHPDYYPDEYRFFVKGEIKPGEEISKIFYLKKKTGTIYGTVSDKDTNQPIYGAFINLVLNGKTLLDKDGDPIQTTTDSEGGYEISELDPGQYSVFVFHRNYLDYSQIYKTTNLIGTERKEVNFSLTKISGASTFDFAIKLVDEQNNFLTIDDLEEEGGSGVQIYLAGSDKLNIPLWINYDIRYDVDTGQEYYIFYGIPSDQNLSVVIRISGYFFDEKNRSYKYKSVDQKISDCKKKNNQLCEITIKLQRDYSFINEVSKPDLRGRLSILDNFDESYLPEVGIEKDACHLLYPLHYLQNREKVDVVLTKTDTGAQLTEKADEEGFFEFLDLDHGKYKLTVTADCYQAEEAIIKIEDEDVEDEKVFLKYKEECIQYFSSNEINGVKFYFLGADSQQYNNSNYWQEISKILNELESKIKLNPGIPPIYIVDSSFVNGMYDSFCSLHGEGFGVIRVTTALLSSPDLTNNLEDMLIHEYGHYVQNKLYGSSVKIVDEWMHGQWEAIFNAAESEANCVFGVVKDCLVNGANNDISGHPDDGPDEFFASFFVSYFKYKSRLKSMLIGDKALPDGECKNTLRFAWNFFAEKVANTPSEIIPIETTSSLSNKILLFKDDKEIFGPVVGGKIGNNIFTPDQIRKGLWKQSVYDGLKPAQKAQLKASLAYRRTLNYLKIDPEKYGNKIDINVVKFNSFIDKMLGARGDRGSIEGVVKEQNGGAKIPKENAIVIIGKKMAITDKDGKFKIEKIKTGEQKVRVIDGKTSKNLDIDLETVNIQKDKTIKRYFNVD
ncbi:MAG: carboxypeptidase regulatory-like domain-containing protein, partial [Candidatus Berkelbacteria bacterium]|nr:carboxypeptidase regulatory-like domain-containing protein [Candidatus Berkelbacteria bacterium]